MKVLVACEFSGVVREAFKARGHDAWSCDLLDTEIEGQHIKGDVLDYIDNNPFNSFEGWDLMIAHPPCTYLSIVGNRHLKIPGRIELRKEAFEFFIKLYNADIPKICIENPVGYINTALRKPDQIIHPYYFGEPYLKRTCLWLKNLPLLDYSKTIINKPEPLYICKGNKSFGKKINWVEGIKGKTGKERSKERSKTFKGIACAMAQQWG